MKPIIRKYLSGESDQTDQSRLLDWVRQDGNMNDFRQEKSAWEKETVQQPVSASSKVSWDSIQGKLLFQTQKRLERTTISLKFFRYAAIFLVLLSISSVTLYFTGRDSASALVYTTVKAEPGQIANVVLPDQSEVWLNSGSSIRYNNEFSHSNRSIQLEGEAYFSVTKNPELPLIIQNPSSIDVKVLGTKFNVAAYPEDNFFHVTLQEGRVELSSSTYKGVNHALEPGEQAVFDKKTAEFQIKKVNAELFTSWKDGLINFYNLPLEEIVIKLEKRFNQKFEVDEEVKQLKYTYTIENESLPEILKLMERITPIDIVQEGEVIRIVSSK